jgi:hypothetical protein
VRKGGESVDRRRSIERAAEDSEAEQQIRNSEECRIDQQKG